MKMKREKNYENLIKEGLTKLSNIVVSASRALQQLYNGESEKYNDVLDLESQGDKLVYKIDKAIEEIKISPTLQIDRSRLVHRVDDIIDAQERLARNYSIYYDELDEDSKTHIKDLADGNHKASLLLNEAIETFFVSFDEALVLVKEITKFRDETRSLIYKIRENVFKSAVDWKEYYALDTLVKRHRDILEEIKDAAAVISHITIKYST